MPIYHVTYFPKQKKYEVNFAASANKSGIDYNLDELVEATTGELTTYTQRSSYAAALGQAEYLVLLHQARMSSPNPVEAVSAETKALRRTLDVLVEYMRANLNDVEAGDMLDAIRKSI